MKKEDLEKFRDTFLTSAEIIDEMIVLYDKEEAGEKVNEKELEILMGRFMIQMCKLQSIPC